MVNSILKTLFCVGIVVGAVSCSIAQDGIRERIREMQKLRNKDPKSFISDVPGTVQKSFDHDKLRRTFLVHTPKTYDGKSALPLVLAFHGGLGTGRIMEQSSQFSAISDRENFIVVYPDGVDNHWNDGRGAAFSGSPNADDISFVAALLEYLQKNYKIDEKRIYATGGSNGGIFSHRLGVEMSDKFAAIAPVIANIAIDPKSGRPFTPVAGKTKPVAVLMINGTDDRLILWNGGKVGGSDGSVTSVTDSVSAWVKTNGCGMQPRIENLPDKYPDDKTTVRRESYSGCRNSTNVVLYAVVGGGHGWHGSDKGRPAILGQLVGNLSREIDSSAIIWEFFKTHKK